MSAYFEMNYQREGDDQPVVLLAELPSIRAIDVGGAAGELRLPGVDPHTRYVSVAPSGDSFTVRPYDDSTNVLLNDAELDKASRWLSEGDCLSVGKFRLTFHEGTPDDEDGLIDTPQRWRMRSPEAASGPDDGDDPSAPYIKDFELTNRPLMNGDKHDEVERRASTELRRLIQADQAETYERFCRFLWTLRVAALSRLGRRQEAEEACEHAIDLYPQDASLLIWLGTARLRARNWTGAARAFERCLRAAARNDIRFLHVSRVGLLLARDEQRMSEMSDGGYHRTIEPHSTDWDVPVLELQAPGDEIVYWHLIRSAKLFGSEQTVQFRFLGDCDDVDDETYGVQRWEIFARSAGRIHRRLIRLPTTAYADPSLLVEGVWLRQQMSQHDPNWMQGVIDLSDQENSLRRSPLVFEPSVIEELSRTMKDKERIVRVETARRTDDTFSFKVNFVAAPKPDDVVYEQGALRVAVAEADVELLAGARLSWRKDADGEGFCLESPNFSRVRAYRGKRAARPKRTSRRRVIARAAAISLPFFAGLIVSWWLARLLLL